MAERRKNGRYIIDDMDIQCRMLFASEIRLLNISFGGASIRSNKKLNMGSRYTLAIKGDDETVSLDGVVVREKIAELVKNEAGETVPIYEIGLSFDGVLTGKGDELIEFIQDNIIPKSAELRLKGLRVDMRESKDASIAGFQKNYHVHKISLNGMLIETEQKMEIDSKCLMEMNLSDDDEAIRFLGRVASCLEIPGHTPKRYDSGIEFVEMSEQDKAKLKDFIGLLQQF